MKTNTILALVGAGAAVWFLTRKKGGTMKGLGAGEGYPPPGSFYAGPEPAAPPGGWPAESGVMGSSQKRCQRLGGGRWIGPKGGKWCQLPVVYAGEPWVKAGIVGKAVSDTVSQRECEGLKAAIRREEAVLADYRTRLAKRGCA